MKLKDMGIIWIDESEMYVADIDLYGSGDSFLRAVIKHIKELVDSYSEAEAGWCRVPDFDRCLNIVTTAYMRHSVNNDDYEWWMEYEPGRGRRKVWCIDFERAYAK